MGAVYLARDPTIGRELAIKVLRTDDEEYRRRFKIEVNAAGALRHRHIITIFDSGEHEGSPFLAMEYIPGETLAEKIKRRELLPVSEKGRMSATWTTSFCLPMTRRHSSIGGPRWKNGSARIGWPCTRKHVTFGGRTTASGGSAFGCFRTIEV